MPRKPTKPRANPNQPDEYKLIPLTRNAMAKVSNEDTELGQHSWVCGVNLYARRYEPPFTLHRLVMERTLGRKLGPKEHVDHINGDRLDNRRTNLRLTNTRGNGFNLGRSKRNRSGYSGVWWDSKLCKYQVTIKADNTRYYIGLTEDLENAAYMRDQWAMALHGEYARLALLGE